MLSHLLGHLESTSTKSVHWPTIYQYSTAGSASTCGRLSEEYDCLLQYLGRTSRLSCINIQLQASPCLSCLSEDASIA